MEQSVQELTHIAPMTWIIISAAAVICIAVFFNKAVKFLLKLAVVAVALLFVLYFLVQDGIIVLPTAGN